MIRRLFETFIVKEKMGTSVQMLMDNYAQVPNKEDQQEYQGVGDLPSDEEQPPKEPCKKKQQKYFSVFICIHRQLTFTVNGKIYKTKKDYFLELNPDKTNANANEIFRFVTST